MKTEHRHDLKTNDLSKVAVEVESFYERHATSLQWGIIGVAFLAACGIYYWRTTSAIEAAAWNELSQSDSADKFAQVATDYSGTRAAPWAKLREANSYLETGLRDAFENREKANTDLKKAKSILTDLAKTGGPRELRQQVLFGLARSIEMTSDGDMKPAIDAYQNLITEFPDTVFKAEAERRIKDLGTSEAKAFYAYFSKQNPKPPEPPKPNDKTGKGTGDPLNPISSGLKDLKESILRQDGGEVPLLTPPKLPDVITPDEGKTAPATKDDSPAVPVDTKAEDKPAADTKDQPAEKPAEPEKKADEGAAKESAQEPATPAAEPKAADAPPEKKAE